MLTIHSMRQLGSRFNATSDPLIANLSQRCAIWQISIAFLLQASYNVKETLNLHCLTASCPQTRNNGGPDHIQQIRQQAEIEKLAE